MKQNLVKIFEKIHYLHIKSYFIAKNNFVAEVSLKPKVGNL